MCVVLFGKLLINGFLWIENDGLWCMNNFMNLIEYNMSGKNKIMFFEV